MSAVVACPQTIQIPDTASEADDVLGTHTSEQLSESLSGSTSELGVTER